MITKESEIPILYILNVVEKNWLIVLLTVFTCLSSFYGTALLGNIDAIDWKESGELYFVGVVVISPILIIIFPLSSIIAALAKFYGGRLSLMETLVITYICTIFIFASVYFLMVFIGDIIDALDKTGYYRELKTKPEDQQVFRDDNKRWFRGIEKRLVNISPNNDGRVFDTPERNDIRKLIADASSGTGVFLRSASTGRDDIFIDCLYFSTATITTLGFGDITPKHSYAKIAVVMEVLIGIFMFGLGLGIALKSFEPDTSQEAE